jgi:signal transduction histidine kinase
MSQPATTVRRDELQTMEKDAVGLAEQTIIPAASERNQGDIADSRLALEAKAAMIENSLAAVFAYDTEERLIYGKAYLPRITYSEEVFLEVKPAKLLPCHVSANHLYDASGATILSYANILDFTEMNAYKARLESKNRELIAANNKAEFASHELRTPLNAVIGFSEMIHSESFGPCDERYRDYALDINQSGQHLLDLINDILDLSKVESGTNEIHDEKMDIREVIESVMTMVKGRAQKGGVKLQLEVPDHPPALRADSRKMKQILVNLLSNAVKFTDPGGQVTFKIWCRKGSGCVFQIVDTGIGIALDDIPKALAPFQQVHSELNRKYEGTGLGLPLTKSLVELHGGSLDLQSRFGVGTTVTVRLPEERVVPVA